MDGKGNYLCACIELFPGTVGRKLKIVDAGPLNLDVGVLNFENHAGFDVTSVVVHSCGA